MASLREKITLTDGNWFLVEIDPDINGYVEMEIAQLNANSAGTQWSPTDTIAETTAVLTKDTPKFDKNIYIKNSNATAEKPVYFAVTRDEKFDSVVIANTPLKTIEDRTGTQGILFVKRLGTIGDGTGVTNMNVDGSIVPVIFKIKPPIGEIWRIATWNLYIQDSGSFDATRWGNGLILTNGVLPRVKIDGITQNLLDFPIKNTGDIAALAGTVTPLAIGVGDEILTAIWSFINQGQYLRLIGDNEDELQLVIQDDLTALNMQYVQVLGYKE